MYIADLHIHSRFSRATSRDCDLPHLDWWARRKGIQLIGTGDFTHPAWRAEMREQLVPAGEGVYALREGLTMEGTAPGAAPRFVVTGEISCIYKRHGRTRKVHNLILLPSLEAAEELSRRLHGRHTDSEEVIQGRLEKARQEATEISKYDYLVINDKVSNAVSEIESILTAAQCRVENRKSIYEGVFAL